MERDSAGGGGEGHAHINTQRKKPLQTQPKSGTPCFPPFSNNFVDKCCREARDCMSLFHLSLALLACDNTCDTC